jgi:hypothetical protein
MEIALHLGAHLTDVSQMRGCLRDNADALGAQGVLIPNKRSFLNMMIDAATQGMDSAYAPDFTDRLREVTGADAQTRRLILSAPGILASRPDITDGRNLYPDATARLAALRKLLGRHEVELFFCIRNPATYIPAVLQSAKTDARKAIEKNLRSEELRWSPLIADMRLHWPEASVTVWCDEDTPFLWHQMLARIAGCTPEGGFRNAYAWYDSIMIEGGAAKLETYLTSAPPVDEAHRQKVIAAFLDKFCDEAKLDVDTSITDWDEGHLDLLSALYEDDVDLIASMDGVNLIQP